MTSKQDLNSKLLEACYLGNDSIALQLLDHPSIDVTIPGFDDWTALHHSARCSGPKVVSKILQKCSDDKFVNVSDRFGMTPLFAAVGHCRSDNIAILLKQKRIDVNLTNIYGGTALHHCAYVGDNLDIATMLVKAGVEVAKKDFRNQTALDVSINRKRSAITTYLSSISGIPIHSSSSDDAIRRDNLKNSDTPKKSSTMAPTMTPQKSFGPETPYSGDEDYLDYGSSSRLKQNDSYSDLASWVNFKSKRHHHNDTSSKKDLFDRHERRDERHECRDEDTMVKSPLEPLHTSDNSPHRDRESATAPPQLTLSLEDEKTPDRLFRFPTYPPQPSETMDYGSLPRLDMVDDPMMGGTAPFIDPIEAYHAQHTSMSVPELLMQNDRLRSQLQCLSKEYRHASDTITKLESTVADMTLQRDLPQPMSQNTNAAIAEQSKNSKFEKWYRAKVGLLQYLSLFYDNGFDDMRVLEYLTETELEKMGISRRGHKLLILRCIDELKNATQRSINTQLKSTLIAATEPFYGPSTPLSHSQSMDADDDNDGNTTPLFFDNQSHP